MIYLYLRQRVADYARWREGFDDHAAARQAGGATNEAYLLRNVDDPHDVTVILGWSSLEDARTFSQSVSLQEAIHKAGVTSLPEILFLEAAG